VELDDAVNQTAEQAGRQRRGVVVGAIQGGRSAVAGRGDDGHGKVPDGRTLFEIGSVTKVFTSLLLADGVVRGEWELDTPVVELLPDVAIPQRDGTPITLENLATHTSGLPGFPAPLSWRGAVDVLRAGVDVLRGADPYRGLTSEVLLERVSRMQLSRTPGTGQPDYSNTGVALLGLAMERASGTAYDDLLRTRVSRPLGLSDTLTRRQSAADQQARTALGCRKRGGSAAPWPLEGMQGAGALLSTMTDLLCFLSVQLDPTGSVLEEPIRMTQQHQAVPHIGLGWLRGAKDTLWHNGGTGGFCSFVGLCPTEGMAVAVVTNQARDVNRPSAELGRHLSQTAPETDTP